MEPSTQKHSFFSYFNYNSGNHHAVDQFKKLSGGKEAAVLILTGLSSLIAIPFVVLSGGTLGCAIFRKLTYAFTPSKIQQKTNEVRDRNLNPGRTENVQSTIPFQGCDDLPEGDPNHVSPIHPEKYLMRTPEKIHTMNGQIAGFRAETVPRTDYTQAAAPHCDDMTSYHQYEDGTCSIIVTDGEGGSPASDSFSHFINAFLHANLAQNRSTFQQLLANGQVNEAKQLAEMALKDAFEKAKAAHRALIIEQGGDFDNDEDTRYYEGATTVAAIMTVTDPNDPNTVWAIGVNIYDSPIVLLHPNDPPSVEVYQTHSNCNLSSHNKTYEEYLGLLRDKPQFIVKQIPANTLLMVMSDGVTEKNLPTTINGKQNPEKANAEIGEALLAVITNPYFDSYPISSAPENMTMDTLKELGNERTPLSELTPEMISKRVRHFVFWRTQITQWRLLAWDPIAPLFVETRLLQKRGEYDKFVYNNNVMAVMPKEKWKEFKELMHEQDIDTSELVVTEMDSSDAQAYNKYKDARPKDSRYRINLEKPEDFVMVDWDQLQEFRQNNTTVEEKESKVDGTSLIAAVAKK